MQLLRGNDFYDFNRCSKELKLISDGISFCAEPPEKLLNHFSTRSKKLKNNHFTHFVENVIKLKIPSKIKSSLNVYRFSRVEKGKV